MNAMLLSVVLFVSVFTLEAAGSLSNLYRSQFGMFLTKDLKMDGILSIADVEIYHQNDKYNEHETKPPYMANPGFFKNGKFFSAMKAVAKNLIPEIEKERLHVLERRDDLGLLRSAMSETSSSFSDNDIYNPIAILDEYMADSVKVDVRLLKLISELERIPEACEKGEVMKVIAGMFRAIIFRMSEDGKEELPLAEFLTFMSEGLSDTDFIAALLRTAFKEYMLGLIKRESNNWVSADELKRFLETDCGMEGDLSESFERFGQVINPSHPENVPMSTVREKWSRMNLRSVFHTLFEPSRDTLQA